MWCNIYFPVNALNNQLIKIKKQNKKNRKFERFAKKKKQPWFNQNMQRGASATLENKMKYAIKYADFIQNQFLCQIKY